MRSIEDKGCLNYGQTEEIPNSNSINFEFQRGTDSIQSSRRRTALGKPTPSKWDDAQKWLVNLSRGGERSQSKTKPRNSNADDRRLITEVPKQEEDCSSDEGIDDGILENGCIGSASAGGQQCGVETKNVDCVEPVWRVNKPARRTAASAGRSVCVRDMGTEMTPMASQEPSRTGTPVRGARSPLAPSPMNSRSSTPVRGGRQATTETSQAGLPQEEANRGTGTASRFSRDGQEFRGNNRAAENNNNLEQAHQEMNPMETRAIAWDEAERAKYMARFKQEEVKIQAWENREKRKAEMEMKRMEVKAERLKSRAQERLTNKVTATRRIAEEKRANAEAKLNEKGVKTSERADYIRRTGHMPSSFSFKLPSCW